MPEMPEIEAHAERLKERFVGQRLTRFQPLNFMALKTAVPTPDTAYGHTLKAIDRRGKYLLFRFEPLIMVIHLMQGGRLVPDEKLSKKPRGGQARLLFDGSPALLLTEHGTERRAGVWCIDASADLSETPPLNKLGPEAVGLGAAALAERCADTSLRIHGFLRDQRQVAGLGRRLANEVCWEARVSPFATTKKLGAESAAVLAAAIDRCAAESLAYERTRPDMSSSKDRPANAHGRTGERCPRTDDHDDTIHAVEYSGYTVNYCPSCQTGGRILADNTTSKFLK